MSCKLYWGYSLFKTYIMKMLITHSFMPYDKKIFVKRTKKWSSIPHVNCHREIYSRRGDTFIYINIKKSYKHELIEDTKRCVNHDGDWRRINKNLTTINHASEKCKRKAWHRGTECYLWQNSSAQNPKMPHECVERAKPVRPVSQIGSPNPKAPVWCTGLVQPFTSF
jgi:hypothetical protein